MNLPPRDGARLRSRSALWTATGLLAGATFLGGCGAAEPPPPPVLDAAALPEYLHLGDRNRGNDAPAVLVTVWATW